MNNMNKDFFYSNLDKNFLSKDKEEFLDNLKKYSETNKKQIYILEKPLLGKENYFYKEATAVFIPKHKILILKKKKILRIILQTTLKILAIYQISMDIKKKLEDLEFGKSNL